MELRQGPLRVHATPGSDDRLTTPLVRDEETGELRPASWTEAFGVAARGLAAAEGSVGVLTGGRLTGEDAYAYSKFARVALGTNDIDFRARAHSAEEADFLGRAGRGSAGARRHVRRPRAAPRVVLLAGFEPEDESPIVFLRLRKAARDHGTEVVLDRAVHLARARTRCDGTLVRTAPGDEAGRAASALADDGEIALDGGGVILVGERLATVPGALSAALALAATTGARLAWVPRRAGERGALETGCLPNLLPGGRPVADAGGPGRPRHGVGRARCRTGDRPRRRRDPRRRRGGRARRRSSSAASTPSTCPTRRPPAAALARRGVRGEPGGARQRGHRSRPTWCSRSPRWPRRPARSSTGRAGCGPSSKVLREPDALPDVRVLAGIAEELGVDLGFRTVEQARGRDAGDRAVGRRARRVRPASEPAARRARRRRRRRPGCVLATWKLLIDDGRMLDGEDYLKATGARRGRAGVGRHAAPRLGLVAGQQRHARPGRSARATCRSRSPTSRRGRVGAGQLDVVGRRPGPSYA